MKILLKIFKWLLIIVIGLIAIFFIVNAAMDNKVVMEESIEINAPASIVYEEVVNFSGWGEWAVWNQMDPDMESEYSETFGEVGSFSDWKSKHPQVGNGRQEVVEIEKNKLMKVKMSFEGWDGVSYAAFHFNEMEGVTEVKWTFDGAETPIYMNWMNSLMEPMLHDNYKKSLTTLKKLVESKPVESSTSLNIEEVEVDPMEIVSILDSTTADAIGQKLGELYAELSIFLETNESASSSGMPLALYHHYSPEKVILEAAIPYEGEAEASGRVKVKHTPSGKALRGIHYGDYNASGSMHEAMESYVKSSEYELQEYCWEVYANDPTEVDSALVETHIYYPLK
ncbi:MAG: hypothetical protein CMO34_04360 [Verrucomicrobia bacterium]|nr:hypothetical protein [Verrucomicrobiota bacterium]